MPLRCGLQYVVNKVVGLCYLARYYFDTKTVYYEILFTCTRYTEAMQRRQAVCV